MKVKMVMPWRDRLMVVTEDGRLYSAWWDAIDGWVFTEVPLPRGPF